MFIRFDMIHEHDRQTDGQTPHDCYSRVYAYRAAKTMHIQEAQLSQRGRAIPRVVEYFG